jgi:hypothetical protein
MEGKGALLLVIESPGSSPSLILQVGTLVAGTEGGEGSDGCLRENDGSPLASRCWAGEVLSIHEVHTVC